MLIIHSKEHHKRVKKSNLTCPFFPEASGRPKSRSRTTSLRSTTRPKSRAGSRQPQTVATEISSHSDEDSQPVPPRPTRRSRATSRLSTSKERDASDVLRRSTRSSRAKLAPEVEEEASGSELSKSTLGKSRSKSSGKGKVKGPIEVIEEADEDDMARVVSPTKQHVNVKGKAINHTRRPQLLAPRRTSRASHGRGTAEQVVIAPVRQSKEVRHSPTVPSPRLSGVPSSKPTPERCLSRSR
jgi:hypothetical protein